MTEDIRPRSLDIVIFGGTGDLSMRKLMPALYRSEVEGKLAAATRIFAIARKAPSLQEFQGRVRQGLDTFLNSGELCDDSWAAFRQRLNPVSLDIAALDSHWDEFAAQLRGNPHSIAIFYLAIPPSLYGQTCACLAQTGLVGADARIVLEKPIGYDLESARVINDQVAQHFDEHHIYRIDHYLGKATVQNLLALRFTNLLFETLWDGKSIDQVQITLAETVGLEDRAEFYDKAGALRDMMQNHLLQLLCLVAMEPPHKLDAENIRAEKLKVLKALRPLTGDDIHRNAVRGQYGAGEVNGAPVPGYLTELGAESKTETYAAIRAHIDNWRWAGVPFYLRTGKRLQERFAEIVIQFKPVTHQAYGRAAGELQPNRLIIRLQPDECIQLQLMAKELHRYEPHLKPVTLNLDFANTYEGFSSDAYKRLLLDVIAGDQSLFAHRHEVEQAWSWLDPILQAWQHPRNHPHGYAAGSWGPQQADALLDRYRHHWVNPSAAEIGTPVNK